MTLCSSESSKAKRKRLVYFQFLLFFDENDYMNEKKRVESGKRKREENREKGGEKEGG